MTIFLNSYGSHMFPLSAFSITLSGVLIVKVVSTTGQHKDSNLPCCIVNCFCDTATTVRKSDALLSVTHAESEPHRKDFCD